MSIEASVGMMEGAIGTILNLVIGLISAVVDFIVGVIHGGISVVVSLFSDCFLINKDMFDSQVINTMLEWSQKTLIVIALALMILIASWQIFKTFFSVMGLNGEMEEPWKIGLKVILFGFLVIYSIDICKYLVANPISRVMQIFFNMKVDVSNGNIGNVTYGENVFNMLEAFNPTNYVAFSTSKNLFVVIAKAIIMLYIDWKLFVFMMSIAQKYINMIIYIAISPLAFACGVTRATADTFKSWVKLFAGGVAIQALQLLILQLISVYSRILTTMRTSNWSMLFVYVSICILFEKIEDILGEIGLPSGPRFDMGIGGIINGFAIGQIMGGRRKAQQEEGGES